MRRAFLTGSTVAVFVACALVTAAEALPLAGTGPSVTPLIQQAAHKPNHWYWNGHWWRHGPWSDHVIHGVVKPRRPDALFIPWGAERLRACAKYRSFDPATGTYVTRHGKRRVCR